jgi:alkanesulfonate monooxygenase SsuD/methylene tetrahydromethanopterin reductase-like flavin-dependent oxidoreductase (luciferase family)
VTTRSPLSVLDLSPVPSGATPADALRRTVALARHAEELGYSRYWLAEHHLNPGVAGASPHVLLAVLAGATSRIGLGTAATILGNSTPLRVAEDLGLLAWLHPGRISLGIGRSGARPPEAPAEASAAASPVASDEASPEVPAEASADASPDGRALAAPGAPGGGGAAPAPTGVPPSESAPATTRVVDGLVIPAPRRPPSDGARFALQARLLGRTPGDGDDFEQDVQDLLGLLDGTCSPGGDVPVRAVPAEGSGLEVCTHGSSAGPSARLAGRLGLPFGANYHVMPSFVLEAVAEYRRSFRPGRIPRPHVIVSADVVVAPSQEEADHVALGYGQWVHSIRAGQGAIPYPSPQEELESPLDADAQAVVQDRLDTRFVGTPARVAEQLRTLERATGADELLLTTIAHDQDAQLRSFALLAQEWGL